MINLKAFLFDDGRGVSPVIGVILMVAITVILAAVIATFVMNMGPSESTPANANWDWSEENDGSNDYLELSHEGGGAAPASEYIVKVSWSTGSSTSGTQDLDVGSSGGTNYGVDAELSASDTLRVYGEDASPPSSPPYSVQLSGQAGGTDVTFSDITQVELIWQDPEGDQSQIIDSWEA